MSKTQLYLLVGVVALSIVGGGAYVAMRTAPTTNTGVAPTDTSKTEGPMSMRGLLASTISQKCTFTTKTENSESSGVVYVAEGKMRGDFNSVAMGKTIVSHMITRDGTSYIWSDAATQGMKVSVSQMTPSKDAVGRAQTESQIDMDAQFDYACTPWSADESLFALPGNITFTDLGAMMKGAMPQTKTITQPGTPTAVLLGDSKASQCGACDQAPEPSRTQCRTALGCK